MDAQAAPSSLPWVEKYRPKNVSDILSHQDHIETITRLIDNRKMPHLLFFGPAGTGKTSTVMACARRLYGDKLRQNVLELNASDDRGIGTIRGVVKEFASTQRLELFGAQDASKQAPFKMVVLDEADQMTNEAQFALRGVIEMFSRNVRFCIICNHINKILQAIRSRCTGFCFGPLPKKAVMHRLREVSLAEEVMFADEGLAAVYRLSQGDMRRALNVMQGVVMSRGAKEGPISEVEVYDSAGSPSPALIRSILDCLVNRNVRDALKDIRVMTADRGIALADVVRELHPWLVKMDLPPDVQCWAVEKLADLEHQMVFGSDDTVATAGLVGAMQLVRAAITDTKRISELVVPSQMDEL
eukprot:Hpha_TRINITY_DN9977_c0_g1::TRINITY_DN9977_c0_g1_i1::g.140609::m.140609/K10756/RFC3_5; replication factor C subunit 3/5